MNKVCLNQITLVLCGGMTHLQARNLPRLLFVSFTLYIASRVKLPKHVKWKTEYCNRCLAQIVDFQTDVYLTMCMQEMALAFLEEEGRTRQERLLLTAAVGVGQSVVESAYEVAEISK